MRVVRDIRKRETPPSCSALGRSREARWFLDSGVLTNKGENCNQLGYFAVVKNALDAARIVISVNGDSYSSYYGKASRRSSFRATTHLDYRRPVRFFNLVNVGIVYT